MIPHEILDKMTNQGGSFAKAIARAYYAADSINRARLEAAFAELFERYK